jgi:hypothetical protein
MWYRAGNASAEGQREDISRKRTLDESPQIMISRSGAN